MRVGDSISGGPLAGVWWDICSEDFFSADEAEAFVYDTLVRVFPHGGHGFTMWWDRLCTTRTAVGTAFSGSISMSRPVAPCCAGCPPGSSVSRRASGRTTSR